MPVEERIAVFDNDGTLWSEKPMPTQLHYVVEQWRSAAERAPELAERQPYLAAVSGDFGWLSTAIDKHYSGDDSDLKTIIQALVGLTDGMSVEDYALFCRGVLSHGAASGPEAAVRRRRVPADGRAAPVPGGARLHLLQSCRAASATSCDR